MSAVKRAKTIIRRLLCAVGWHAWEELQFRPWGIGEHIGIVEFCGRCGARRGFDDWRQCWVRLQNAKRSAAGCGAGGNVGSPRRAGFNQENLTAKESSTLGKKAGEIL